MAPPRNDASPGPRRHGAGSPGRRLALVAALVLIGACSAGQDPSFEPPGADRPATTSDTLPPCPAGGPDSTTPAAGCVGDDGAILRP